MDQIPPLELKHLLLGEEEFALIDVREQGTFSKSHLLFAVCVPLSRLELQIGELVPRKDTRLVIVDDSADDGLSGRALRFGGDTPQSRPSDGMRHHEPECGVTMVHELDPHRGVAV